jgi:hypothetical protein
MTRRGVRDPMFENGHGGSSGRKHDVLLIRTAIRSALAHLA